MNLQDIVTVDVETGGLDPLSHSLLSVAFVSEESSMSFYVKEPDIVWDYEALAVNKIALSTVRDEGVTPSEACDRIEAFMMPYNRIAGHNVAFDIAFLRRLYWLAERRIPKVLSYRALDTNTLLWAAAQRGLIPAEVNNADRAFEHFKIEVEGRHSALGDAQATYQLLKRLLTLR